MKNKEAERRSHQEIQDLLPWYINETLPAAEHEWVAAHLFECSTCRAELETLQDLRSVVRDSNERLPHPSEGQLDALVARIEESEASGPRQNIRAFGARVGEWWAALPTLAKSAMLAQAVAVLVLMGVSVALLRRVERSEATAIGERQRADLNESLLARERQSASEYRALSGGQTDGSDGTGIKINVAFRENAREKQIRDLLMSLKATIISGPSARFYVIRIAAPPESDPQSIMNDALAQLRHRDDLVEFAEPRP